MCIDQGQVFFDPEGENYLLLPFKSVLNQPLKVFQLTVASLCGLVLLRIAFFNLA